MKIVDDEYYTVPLKAKTAADADRSIDVRDRAPSQAGLSYSKQARAMATASAMTTGGQGHHHQPLPRRTASSKQKQNRGSSKSRPPVPVVIAHECPSAMRAHVVEVPAGRDVLSCVSAFARRGRRGALVLGAAGHVTDVVLREPALVLRGTMEILSLAGCFFPFPGPADGSTGTAVFLAGPRGSVLGGGVAPGGLVAAGPVVVMVATFVAAALDRLPLPKGEDAAGTKAQQRQGCDVHGHHRPCGWTAVCRKQQQNLGADI